MAAPGDRRKNSTTDFHFAAGSSLDKLSEQFIRELDSLREIVGMEIEGKVSTLNAKLQSIDRAIELLGITGNKSHEFISLQVERLREVAQERFQSIEKQFADRDKRSEQILASSHIQMNAALLSGKEQVAEQNKNLQQSISKSEAAFTKQIDQILTLIQNTIEAMNGKIDDNKQRITAIENKTQGSHFQSTRTSNTLNQVLAGVVAFIAVMGAVVSVVLFMAYHAH
jgi:hypothetical protein